jgi:hypothetical protein
MMKNTKLSLLASAMLVVLPAAAGYATTTNMDATAYFRAAIVLTNTAMDFSKIDYSAAPSAGADNVTLGTDGVAGYNGVFAVGDHAAPAAGTVTITSGTAGENIEVRCDATATLSNVANTSSIGITNIEVTDDATDAGGLPTGTGSACLGVGGAAAITTTLAVNDVFRFGGKINGGVLGGAWAAGAYSTGNAGGDDIVVDITYQ